MMRHSSAVTYQTVLPRSLVRSVALERHVPVDVLRGYRHLMSIEIVFETHSTSEDNERGVASGWAHSRLSDIGQQQARALGERRQADGIDVVFSSDLRRAVETAE